VESRLKLGAVIRLDDLHAKRQAPTDFVDEPDGRALVAGVVHLEDANAGAIVDGGALVESFPGAGDPLEELHVSCRRWPGCGFSYRCHRS
jgi:hypothetical protein